MTAPFTGENPWTHWRCSLHGFTGSLNDGSLDAHQDAEHDGMLITVMLSRGADHVCSERDSMAAGHCGTCNVPLPVDNP